MTRGWLVQRYNSDKPPLVNQQCIVYNFRCNLCDAGYVGYTCQHLHQRIEEHKGSTIGNHLKEATRFWNAFYQRTETNSKQTMRFHPRKIICLGRFLITSIVFATSLFKFFNFTNIFLSLIFTHLHILSLFSVRDIFAYCNIFMLILYMLIFYLHLKTTSERSKHRDLLAITH